MLLFSWVTTIFNLTLSSKFNELLQTQSQTSTLPPLIRISFPSDTLRVKGYFLWNGLSLSARLWCVLACQASKLMKGPPSRPPLHLLSHFGESMQRKAPVSVRRTRRRFLPLIHFWKTNTQIFTLKSWNCLCGKTCACVWLWPLAHPFPTDIKRLPPDCEL